MRRVLLLFTAVAGLTVAAMPAPGGAAETTGDSRFTGPVDTAPQVAPQEAWAWTQLTDQGTEVRYVTPETSCPRVDITDTGGQTTSHQMVTVLVRTQSFPTEATVCGWRVQANATTAQIDTSTVSTGVTVRPTSNGTVPLPAWTTRPGNIAVIGDTGCRVVSATDFQNCQQDWHFDQVASNAAAAGPDLVVHTGDYIYRTDNQVFPAPSCGGPGTSANVHTWGCLVADFFEPAAPLLAQAPIVFVRGNHELCNRSGQVWFRYQASTPVTTCNDFTPPELVRAGELHLLLLDSVAAEDTVDPGQVATYAAQLNTVNGFANASNNNFLLSHKPFWTATRSFPTANPGWQNHTLAAAVPQTSAQELDGRIRTVLSGHVHLYQMLDFGPTPPLGAPHRPPQVTVGSSGTTLDTPVNDAQVQGRLVDGLPVGQVITHAEWGYALLGDQGGTIWNLRYFNRFGGPVGGTNCTLNAQATAFTNCM